MKMETITPTKAKIILGNNPKNRQVRPNHVLALAHEIENDHWLINGDAIRIAKSGILLDGQHRLLAVIKADKAIKSYIVNDLDEKALNTIDVGKNRSAADVFQIQGIPYHARTSSVTYNMYLWDTGRMHWNSGMTFRDKPTHDTLFNLYMDHKKEIDVAVSLSYSHKCNPIKAKNVAFVSYLLRKKHRANDISTFLSHI